MFETFYLLSELQRLTLEAYPDIQAGSAAGGRPAVVAENRANERPRRIKENFINGMPIKLRRVLLSTRRIYGERTVRKSSKPYDCRPALPRRR